MHLSRNTHSHTTRARTQYDSLRRHDTHVQHALTVRHRRKIGPESCTKEVCRKACISKRDTLFRPIFPHTWTVRAKTDVRGHCCECPRFKNRAEDARITRMALTAQTTWRKRDCRTAFHTSGPAEQINSSRAFLKILKKKITKQDFQIVRGDAIGMNVTRSLQNWIEHFCRFGIGGKVLQPLRHAGTSPQRGRLLYCLDW